jgi:hypothetical protein
MKHHPCAFAEVSGTETPHFAHLEILPASRNTTLT